MGGAVSSGTNNSEIVDNLVEAEYIKSPAVEKVFRAVDRGNFYLSDHRVSAYKDMAWKHETYHLSSPCIYAEVLEALQIEEGCSFLNMGSGIGYLSTMAGLIIGNKGVNHGIEIYSENVEYAQQKIDEFILTNPNFDKFDFCVPKMVVGNLLLIDGYIADEFKSTNNQFFDTLSNYYSHISSLDDDFLNESSSDDDNDDDDDNDENNEDGVKIEDDAYDVMLLRTLFPKENAVESINTHPPTDPTNLAYKEHEYENFNNECSSAQPLTSSSDPQHIALPYSVIEGEKFMNERHLKVCNSFHLNPSETLNNLQIENNYLDVASNIVANTEQGCSINDSNILRCPIGLKNNLCDHLNMEGTNQIDSKAERIDDIDLNVENINKIDLNMGLTNKNTGKSEGSQWLEEEDGLVRYDRVYVGCAVPSCYLNYVKQFVKVGGSIVLPLNDNLVRLRRVSESNWKKKKLFQVSFADLIEPFGEYPQQPNANLPKIKVGSLQEFCRNVIRATIRTNLIQRKNIQIIIDSKDDDALPDNQFQFKSMMNEPKYGSNNQSRFEYSPFHIISGDSAERDMQKKIYDTIYSNMSTAFLLNIDKDNDKLDLNIDKSINQLDVNIDESINQLDVNIDFSSVNKFPVFVNSNEFECRSATISNIESQSNAKVSIIESQSITPVLNIESQSNAPVLNIESTNQSDSNEGDISPIEQVPALKKQKLNNYEEILRIKLCPERDNNSNDLIKSGFRGDDNSNEVLKWLRNFSGVIKPSNLCTMDCIPALKSCIHGDEINSSSFDASRGNWGYIQEEDWIQGNDQSNSTDDNAKPCNLADSRFALKSCNHGNEANNSCFHISRGNCLYIREEDWIQQKSTDDNAVSTNNENALINLDNVGSCIEIKNDGDLCNNHGDDNLMDGVATVHDEYPVRSDNSSSVDYDSDDDSILYEDYDDNSSEVNECLHPVDHNDQPNLKPDLPYLEEANLFARQFNRNIAALPLPTRILAFLKYNRVFDD